MKGLEILLPYDLKVTLPRCQRVPSGVTRGDCTNICSGSCWSNQGEEFHPFESRISCKEEFADDTLNHVDIYHNENYIGRVRLDTELPDCAINVPDHRVELHFYLQRYFETVAFYGRLNRHKVIKKAKTTKLTRQKRVSPGANRFLGRSLRCKSKKTVENGRNKKCLSEGQEKCVSKGQMKSASKGQIKCTSKLQIKTGSKGIKSVSNGQLKETEDISKDQPKGLSENNITAQGNSTSKTSENQYVIQLTWLRNCIETYLPNMRKLYDHYSQLMVDNEPGNHGNEVFYPRMNRLVFWQLLRDYGLHKQFDSIVTLETLLQRNPYVSRKERNMFDVESWTSMGKAQRNVDGVGQSISRVDCSKKTENSNVCGDTGPVSEATRKDEAFLDPFERLSFYQFVHCLIELSWLVFSGQRATQKTIWPTHLAGCLYRLMSETLKRQGEEGVVLRSDRYRRMVPGVYAHFRHLGNPLSVRYLLRLLKSNKLQAHDDSFTTSECWQLIDQLDECRFGYKDKSCLCDENTYNETAGNLATVVNTLCAPQTGPYVDRPDGESLSSIDTCLSNMSTLNEKLSATNVTDGAYGKSAYSEMYGIRGGSEMDRKATPESRGKNMSGQSTITYGSYGNFKGVRCGVKKSVVPSGKNEDGHRKHDDGKGIYGSENLPVEISKSLFKLELHEILNAVAQVCPKLTSHGTVVTLGIALSFLEYFELLVLLCELNADKVRRLLKFEAVDQFYNEHIAPLHERERAAKALRKLPGGPTTPPKKGKKR
ncbi:hypothetical protein M8J76_004857 [Diaphorina citri]|nr:hypothetical protein M8J76_004857 [Diaphorina citri]